MRSAQIRKVSALSRSLALRIEFMTLTLVVFDLGAAQFSTHEDHLSPGFPGKILVHVVPT